MRIFPNVSTLRAVFSPPDAEPTGQNGRPKRLTLPQFYDEHFAPWLADQGRKPATHAEYATTVRYWQKCWPELTLAQLQRRCAAAENGFGRCPIAQFRLWLAQQPGRSAPLLAPHTIRKHCQNLRAIIRFAGPRSDHRAARSILAQGLPVRMPDIPRKEPRGMLTVAELAAIARAAGDGCRRPRSSLLGCDCPTYWAALLSLGYYTGLRPCALLRLRWGDFEDGTDADGGQTFFVRGEINKFAVAHSHWAHPEAVHQLARLRSRLAADAVYLFAAAWPALASADWPRHAAARAVVGRGFKALAASAGVRLEPGNALKSLRKTCATELAAISDTAAQLALSHKPRAVLANHYAQTARLIKSAVQQMPSLDDAIKTTARP